MGFKSLFKSNSSSKDKKAAPPKGVVLPPGAAPGISLMNAAGTARAGTQGGRPAGAAHAAGTVPAREHGQSRLFELRKGLSMNTKSKDKSGKGSQEYKTVMDKINDLLAVLETKIPQDISQRAEALSNISGLYEAIETSCNSFLSRDRVRWTATSRNRKTYIEEVLNAVQDEKKAILRANQERDAKATWVDVLREVRTETIDVTPYRKKVEGAGTSVVTHVLEGPDKGYFKKEENMNENSEVLLSKAAKSVPEDRRNKLEEFLRKALQQTGGATESAFGIQDSKFTDEAKKAIRVNYERFLGRKVSDEEYDECLGVAMNTFKLQNATYTMMDAGINTSDELTKRNVASTRLAELLGVSNLYARSRSVNMKNGDSTEKGMIMDPAQGQEFKDIKKKYKAGNRMNLESPELQRSLICIQMLDTIAGQIDHHMGNIFFEMDGQGKVGSAQAIDNDMSFGKLDRLDRETKTLHQFKDDKDNFTGGLLDKEMAGKIIALDPQILRYAMIDLLSDQEITALLNRLKTMKDILIKLRDSNSGDLIDRGGWNAQTAQKLKLNQNNYYRDFLKTLDSAEA